MRSLSPSPCSPGIAWKTAPAWAPSRNSWRPFLTPNFSKVCDAIAAGDATTARCMSPGACSCCEWPCDIPPSSRRWRNSGVTRLSADSSASRRTEDVPGPWNISRFEDVLGQEPHLSEVQNIFNSMVRNWGWPCPIWAKTRRAIPRPCTPAARRARKAASGSRRGLPQPSGGKKEYTDDEGKVIKIFEWFGYKLHLLVDVKHEVVLAYQVTTANAADNQSMPDLVEQGQANLPEGRIETLAYDKAADDDKSTIADRRASPGDPEPAAVEGQTEQMLPGHDGTSTSSTTRRARLHCYDCTSQPVVRHQMAYIGYESSGNAQVPLPGPARGLDLSHDKECNAGKSYGKTVRVDQTWTCGVSRPFRGRRRSSSASTTAARRWNGSTPG